MPKLALSDKLRPIGHLIGTDSKGRFKTFQAKEYPIALNQVLAYSMVSEAPSTVKSRDSLAEVFEQISKTSTGQEILPDFQGTG